ncbi:hypothetical protein [Denitromonas sp.]|uniref:hypothetical protein n=1 Tax=Denitromonas sp. TaxID=2734609 RepID=UPI003A8C4C7C
MKKQLASWGDDPWVAGRKNEAGAYTKLMNMRMVRIYADALMVPPTMHALKKQTPAEAGVCSFAVARIT